MKYTVGYLGSNEFILEELSKYSNLDTDEIIQYVNLNDISEESLEAMSFNGLIFDTSMHQNEEKDKIIDEIISSNPDIDVMPIISVLGFVPNIDNTNEENVHTLDMLTEREHESTMLFQKYGIHTIPHIVDSKKEATLFMNTTFPTLSSKTIRHIQKIEEYRLNAVDNLLKVLKMFSIALELKDPYTRDHSRRVANYSKQIALKLGLSKTEILELDAAGWLHDIGKVGVPDPILLKQGKLTLKERSAMELHSIIGEKLLQGSFEKTEFENVRNYARHHHERYDGTGYPDKISGEDIPLGARILCLADSFDAMTTQRSYNRPKKLEDAIFDIKSNAGGQFDPQLAEIFIELLRQEPEMLKETLGITIDEEGYIKVEHGPEVDKEKIKREDYKNTDDDIPV